MATPIIPPPVALFFSIEAEVLRLLLVVLRLAVLLVDLRFVVFLFATLLVFLLAGALRFFAAFLLFFAMFSPIFSVKEDVHTSLFHTHNLTA